MSVPEVINSLFVTVILIFVGKLSSFLVGMMAGMDAEETADEKKKHRLERIKAHIRGVQPIGNVLLAIIVVVTAFFAVTYIPSIQIVIPVPVSSSVYLLIELGAFVFTCKYVYNTVEYLFISGFRRKKTPEKEELPLAEQPAAEEIINKEE